MNDDVNRLMYTNAILADACAAHRRRIAELNQESCELRRSIKRYRLFIVLTIAIAVIVHFFN